MTSSPQIETREAHDHDADGVYHEQGWLDGHWMDVILMEKLLM